MFMNRYVKEKLAALDRVVASREVYFNKLRIKSDAMEGDLHTPTTQEHWLRGWFRWSPTSSVLLENSEKKLLSYLKQPYDLGFISISRKNTKGTDCKIRSLTTKTQKEAKSTPLVLLHGFASGIGLWVLNLDSLSKDRPIYALDILGFGRSSRPSFSYDAEKAENEFVESIEEWRKEVGLEKFILLGHSMGGYLASSYALQYPDKIKGLILADPWGYPVPDLTVARRVQLPFWVKMIAAMLQPFNPLAAVRLAGPWGPRLIERFRPDIMQKFEIMIDDPADVSNYIYHCNAQTPSGEVAFKSMTAKFGWAKRPMINRIIQLQEDIPIAFIFGSKSWIDSNSGLQVQMLRPDSIVEINTIEGAGHHVYADKAEEFNLLVRHICKKIDRSSLHITLKSNQHDGIYDNEEREIEPEHSTIFT